MRTRPLGLALAVLVPALLASAPAWPAAPAGHRAASPVRLQKPGLVQKLDVDRRIDVNTVNMWVWNNGEIAFNDPNAGVIWPKGTQNTSVFASGIWLMAAGGRGALSEYTQDCVPGAMSGGTFMPDRPEFKVYKVVRWTGDPADTAHVDRSADDLANDPGLDPLVHHAWREYMEGAAPYGAPVRWYHLNEAAPDDSVLGPDVLGDMMLWSVYNDADPSQHGGDFTPATLPLGVEIRQTTFAFNRQGALGNTVFVRYKLYNKGSNTLDSMFVSVWCDPDLGGFTDDLVGCDTTLSLGYCYNATNHDQIYGSRPPAEGYDFFLGPVNAVGDTLPMTSFNKYINGTDPYTPADVYSYMNGVLPGNVPLVDPNGVTTKFFDAGDPVTGQGWLDSNPADRRFLASSGPFRMAPGDSQEVVAAFIIAQGRDRLSSISGLRFFDIFAQDAFDKRFLLPSPPPQPKVSVTESNGQITLCWDAAARTSYPRSGDNAAGYKFEGYNVYQGETVAGPWHLIATYDEIDQIRVIFDQVFDPITGQLIPSYPVAFGSDLGVQFCHTATQDAISGNPLHNGTTYYYAVTAYAYNPEGLPKVLENSQVAVRAMPQTPAAGTNPSTAQIACPTYVQKDPTQPKATDHVTVEVVNPDSINGHVYKIGFAPLPDSVALPGGEIATMGWFMVDSTTGDTLLRNQANREESIDYPVVRGMRIRVVGFQEPVAGLAEGAFLCRPDSPLQGYSGLGGEAFGGGLTEAINLYGGLDYTAIPDSFVTVEIRFSHTQTQKAYRYLRLQLPDGSTPPAGRSYRYAGFVEQPFTVWDTDHNVQLDVAIMERANVDETPEGNLLPLNQQPDTYDALWNPDASDNGGRDLVFPVKSGYTTTPKPEYEVDGGLLDLPSLYVLWARKVSIDARVNDGDVFRILWNAVPAGPNDLYVFGTTPIVRSNAVLARGRLDRVRAVPNPYYTRSRYEQNQFNRVIRFTNLPEVCTIRIFNLAGELVRTLKKIDPTTSVFDWDVMTENRLPVASGVYIYHVDAPGVGSTFGRMVVFMEKERLNSL